MHRLLPFLFFLFLFSCAGDPLELDIVDLDPMGNNENNATPIESTTGTLLSDHEELTLRLSFRTQGGGEGVLALQGKYELQLPSLMIGELKPTMAIQSGDSIWQDLEVQFIPARNGNPALLAGVYLNGSPVYYQQPLPETDAPTGPLTFTSENGSVELTDVFYTPVAGRSSVINQDGVVELNVPVLHYDYYHLPKGSKTFSGWDSQQPVKSGYINRVDLYNIGDQTTDYAIRFTGTLNIPETADYYFKTWGTGNTTFSLNGRSIAEHAGAPGDWDDADSLRLEAGDYPFELRIVQHNGWNVNRISYRKAGTDEPLRFLNAMEERVAIATPSGSTVRELKTDDEPYILRSFLYFPAPKLYEAAQKRTHVVSVGEGDGPHYSVDLQTGALLQVWRGPFADVHNMWDGRGEPQVMKPLGQVVPFDGSPLFAPSATEPWPSAPGLNEEDDIDHDAYVLDEAGRPTFNYLGYDHSFSDQIIPDGKGLLRHISHTAGGNSEYFTQLVAAKSITETAPGEYFLRGPGLRLTITSYDGNQITLQRSGGLERLIAQLPAKGHVEYRMDW